MRNMAYNYPGQVEDQNEDKIHEVIAKERQDRDAWAYYDRIRKTQGAEQ